MESLWGQKHEGLCDKRISHAQNAQIGSLRARFSADSISASMGWSWDQAAKATHPQITKSTELLLKKPKMSAMGSSLWGGNTEHKDFARLQAHVL